MRAQGILCRLLCIWHIATVTVSCCVSPSFCQVWSPIVVKNTLFLGPQLAPNVTNVSRDGGYSALINGKIVWLYDDTKCMNLEGAQISFVSNTASIANEPNNNISLVEDFGVTMVGEDDYGRPQYAILANSTVGTGGWIPFLPDELEFNTQESGHKRIAIWPGTSPTSVSTTQALLFAPLVYVDSQPEDPSKEYQARGMALIMITAPDSGPVATRQGDLIIPSTEVAFGSFATLLGLPSTELVENNTSGRDVYLIGMATGGLQVARVGLDNLAAYSKYAFFDPFGLKFTTSTPEQNISDYWMIYLPGTFSSGGVFYSPYFYTFIMIYFNKKADSTFYIRYLDLDDPVGNDTNWPKGGRSGVGVQQEDAEALVKYAWSPEQVLLVSPVGKGGFNYAGMPHPEYFNRQYFASILFISNTSQGQRQNTWYGSQIVPEDTAKGDGRHLLLSWTSQLQGGTNNGSYQIELAMIEFDDIPAKPSSSSSSCSTSSTPSLTASSEHPHKTASSDGLALISSLDYGGRKDYGVWTFLCELNFFGVTVGVMAVLL